jgi:hypothetical protein
LFGGEMTNKKQHISEEDFQRYLENKMTDAERNAFERELQKHPFEAEALEGMQEISSEELISDLHKLKSKIKTGKRKTRYSYWAAAATILLLVSTGILWFQLKDKSPIPEITESKTIQKQEERVVPLPNKEKEENQADEITATPPEVEAEKSVQVDQPQRSETVLAAKSVSAKPEVEISTIEPVQSQEEAEVLYNKLNTTNAFAEKDSHIAIRGTSKLKSNPIPQNVEFSKAAFSIDSSDKIIRGRIISLADSLPLPGTIILEEGTTNGAVTDMDGNFTLKFIGKNDSLLTASFVGMRTKEFQPSPDSLNVIGLEPEQMALDEVVVTGYGNNQKRTLTSSVSRVTKVRDTKVQPVEGMENYKKYLEENAILPADYKGNREVVRLLIYFDEIGEITKIENKNQADTVVFEEAKNMVTNGPEWNPEIKNGKPIESQTELRIVFRKN